MWKSQKLKTVGTNLVYHHLSQTNTGSITFHHWTATSSQNCHKNCPNKLCRCFISFYLTKKRLFNCSNFRFEFSHKTRQQKDKRNKKMELKEKLVSRGKCWSAKMVHGRIKRNENLGAESAMDGRKRERGHVLWNATPVWALRGRFGVKKERAKLPSRVMLDKGVAFSLLDGVAARRGLALTVIPGRVLGRRHGHAWALCSICAGASMDHVHTAINRAIFV